MAHGDHLGTEKMEHLTESVYWPGKSNDLREKAKSCLIGFQSGKNLKTMLPSTEKNSLEPAKYPLQEIQLDFLGPLMDEKGKKKFVLIAVDNYSKWVWAKVKKSVSAKTVVKTLQNLVKLNGIPK